MALEHPEDFGTDTAGYRVNQYCRFCYRDGAFSDPDLSMGEMIDRGAAILAERGIMTEPRARAFLGAVVPRLGRWREDPLVRTPHGNGRRGLGAGDELC
jgi:hypothetical protein